MLTLKSGQNFLFLPLEFLLNETGYLCRYAIKMGKNASLCDVIELSFVKNVS